MVIDANATQIALALIALVGALATPIVQNHFAARKRAELITKVDRVEHLANATATAGLAREATQAKVIEGLQQDKVDAAAAIVAAAKPAPTVINP